MPQHKGAERRARLEVKRRTANKGKKIEMRKLLKDFDPKTGDNFVAIQSKLDKLARKGIVTKNFAANRKAKLAKAISKAKTA
jgi:small subunit ribosomal protein S20